MKKLLIFLILSLAFLCTLCACDKTNTKSTADLTSDSDLSNIEKNKVNYAEELLKIKPDDVKEIYIVKHREDGSGTPVFKTVHSDKDKQAIFDILKQLGINTNVLDVPDRAGWTVALKIAIDDNYNNYIWISRYDESKLSIGDEVFSVSSDGFDEKICNFYDSFDAKESEWTS